MTGSGQVVLIVLKSSSWPYDGAINISNILCFYTCYILLSNNTLLIVLEFCCASVAGIVITGPIAIGKLSFGMSLILFTPVIFST